MNKKNFFLFLSIFVFPSAFTVLSASSAPSPHGHENTVPSVTRVLLVVPPSMPKALDEKNDLLSFRTSLTVSGVKFDELVSSGIVAADVRGYGIIIMPYAAAQELQQEEIASVTAAVDAGAGIVLDGPSELAGALGIALGKTPVAVERLRDLQFPGIPLYWENAGEAFPVAVSSMTHCDVLCAEERTKAAIAVSGRYGKGKYVYYAPLFDPLTEKGYSRFPFLIETLAAVFGCRPAAERKTSAMYYDPGSRHFENYETLVKLWRKRGVHRVYAGGWYGPECDYERLVRLCHENGILVYCWLEPPMVSKAFWDAYPRWRDRTALLKEARVDWRLLMNLADARCRQAVFAATKELLEKYDWDGVDVAELYFDSANGPDDPEHFTPMNDLVRSEFKKTGGFDPLELFHQASTHYWKQNTGDWKKFAAYRRELCNRLKTEYLDVLSGVRKEKKDFEIIICAIDASMAPQLEDNISEDTKYLLALQKKYHLTLQVEDEWLFWPGKPERYAQLGAYYRNYIKEGPRLEIDLNVVDNHPEGAGGLPSQKPTGEEIRQVVYNMDLYDARPVFYAEDTLYDHDFRNINLVLARRASITRKTAREWEITTPFMVTVHGKRNSDVWLDGEPWFAVENDDVIVPAGKHTLRFAPEAIGRAMAAVRPGLRYISGELQWARFPANLIEFAYREDTSSCYALVSGRPDVIYIDNKRAACAVYAAEGNYSIKLPGGVHSVRVVVK
jgi:hypothetical protein